MKSFIQAIPQKWILSVFILGGLGAGLGIYTLYMSRAHTYLSDDPAACINCHIMTPFYQSWQHSSHASWTTCNDCHVPQNNLMSKYAFKAMDGLYHSAVFTMRAEPQVIRSRKASSGVIMKNCIRCHTSLNTEFVKTGMIEYAQVQEGEGKACWDCHRNIPHTLVNSLSSSPNALAPLPKSPVPEWLKNMMSKKETP